MFSPTPNSLPVVLTVAGSDPSGGAGIEGRLPILAAYAPANDQQRTSK